MAETYLGVCCKKHKIAKTQIQLEKEDSEELLQNNLFCNYSQAMLCTAASVSSMYVAGV